MKQYLFILIISQLLFAAATPNLQHYSQQNVEYNAFDSIIMEEMLQTNIVGCAVGIVKNGRIEQAKVYGHQDLNRKQPLTEDHVFRWASVSKVLTAVAAHKAIEENKMSLSSLVTGFVPNWPIAGQKGNITIEHLLTHKSGIAKYKVDHQDSPICSYKKDRYPNTADKFNAAKSVDVFKDCPLAFNPGNTYLYSSFGYNLLGAAIEGSTGVPYPDYIKQHIADKLKMPSLTAYAKGPGGFDMHCDGKLKATYEGDVEWKLPGGGWSSNIDDLTKFLEGLINGTLLNNTARLWTAPSGNTGRYGLFKDADTVYHGGSHSDTRTYLGFDLVTKSGIVVFINGGDYIYRERFVSRLMTFVTSGIKYQPAADETCVKLQNDCSKRALGVWRKSPNSNNSILRMGISRQAWTETFKMFHSLGYYAADIETWDGTSWDILFKKGIAPTTVWVNLEKADFETKWKEMGLKGLHLIDIETYRNAPRRWAAIFQAAPSAGVLVRDRSSSEIAEKIIEWRDKGYRLLDLETYDGRWAGIWIKGTPTYTLRGLTTDSLQKLQLKYGSEGWQVIDMEAYLRNGYRRWSVVFDKSNDPVRIHYDDKYCNWLQYQHTKNINEGYELIDFDTYN